MKEEYDKFLVETYPKLFINRYKFPQETCMCWGFECSDGWFELINSLCLDIQTYLDNNLNVKQVIVNQVKEKFGSFRFYISGGDEYIRKLIRIYEEKAISTCEYCGTTLHVCEREKLRLKILCFSCYKEVLERYK